MRYRGSRQQMRLTVFDLDGTLTRIPNVWRHLHMKLGTWATGRVFAQRYLDGEINYREWAESDCALWKGTSLSRISEIISGIEYVTGAEETVNRLKEAGMKIGIVSAGISILADRAGKDLNADIVLSNRLLTSDGALTGGIETAVSVDEKPKIICDIAASLSIPMHEVATVGDNVYDIPRESGLRIAFNPKSREAEEMADFVVRNDDLRSVLEIILEETQ